MAYHATATYKRRHRAKLVARLGPSAAVNDSRFLPWSLYHFVGAPGGYKRPPLPAHLTQAEHPGYFEEWARLEMWRQRKRAGIARPATGLWTGARLPQWAITVSKEMDRVGKPPLPPPKPPDPVPTPFPNKLLVQRAQSVIFSAWRPMDALHASGGKIAITADVNVGGDPGAHMDWARQARSLAKQQGKPCAAWANQSQVGIDHLYDFASAINADYCIWQAETIGEMTDVGINPDGSLRPGSPLAQAVNGLVLVGNANAWSDQQRAAATKFIFEGRLAFIQECYSNTGDPWPENYGTQGVPVSSICPGVGWDRFPHQLPAYKEHTPASQWPTISPYIAETFDASSWAVLPY